MVRPNLDAHNQLSIEVGRLVALDRSVDLQCK